jgi:hypothetical protein
MLAFLGVRLLISGNSVAAGPLCGAARGVSSLCHCMAGDLPPLRLGVSDITPPFLRSMADFYCGVAAIWDAIWFIIWKGASPPPLTLEVSDTRTSFRRHLRAIQRWWHGSKMWRWRRTCTSSLPIRRNSEGDISFALEVWLRWCVKSGWFLQPTRLVLALRRPFFFFPVHQRGHS